MDGVGEWATTSAWRADGARIEPLWEIGFPHSLGLLYSAFTYYTGFKVNSGEYKLMGLAPYGSPVYVDEILDKLLDLIDQAQRRFAGLDRQVKTFVDHRIVRLPACLVHRIVFQGGCDEKCQRGILVACDVFSGIEAPLIVLQELSSDFLGLFHDLSAVTVIRALLYLFVARK